MLLSEQNDIFQQQTSIIRHIQVIIDMNFDFSLYETAKTGFRVITVIIFSPKDIIMFMS